MLCQIAAQDPDARYALGSVLSHVLLHQTIIGEEALLQMAKVGETPDLLVRPLPFACACIIAGLVKHIMLMYSSSGVAQRGPASSKDLHPVSKSDQVLRKCR